MERQNTSRGFPIKYVLSIHSVHVRQIAECRDGLRACDYGGRRLAKYQDLVEKPLKNTLPALHIVFRILYVGGHTNTLQPPQTTSDTLIEKPANNWATQNAKRGSSSAIMHAAPSDTRP